MTVIQLYDTMARAKRLFVPMDPANIRIYVCGPTVYDLAHLGNARSAVVFDQLRRMLLHSYPSVTFVRNVTDVEDKIIERAKETGENIAAMTARTHRAYLDDTGALGVLPPSVEPKATEHIPQMISMITRLLGNGNAYTAQGHVLFDVSSNPHAGKLSGHAADDLRAGASGRVAQASYKRNQADFVLWKPSAATDPGWTSPWGYGRPGWHIECSAMAAEHLGEVFDIHAGGHDLIFPHHEAEIAQSTGAHGTSEMARYWLHNGMLTVNGEKMSKSRGNFVTVRDLLVSNPGRAEALRLLLLSSHYRQSLDFTRARLAEAAQQMDRFYGVLRRAEAESGTSEASPHPDEEAVAATRDDLNTPLAIARLHAIASEALLASGEERRRKAAVLRATGAILGLLESGPDAWFQGSGAGGVPNIENLIERRNHARSVKDFKEADRIRGELLVLGVVLEDGPSGTVWRHVPG